MAELNANSLSLSLWRFKRPTQCLYSGTGLRISVQGNNLHSGSASLICIIIGCASAYEIDGYNRARVLYGNRISGFLFREGCPKRECENAFTPDRISPVLYAVVIAYEKRSLYTVAIQQES